MLDSFTIGGVTFHLYGFFIGLAVVLGLNVTEAILAKSGWNAKKTWLLALAVMVGGIVGARVWHVLTDFELYRASILRAVYFWNGGMSILGAIAGGLLVIFAVVRSRAERLQVLDALAFALPVAQAVGRLGNWANQELYGLPTRLPWKLYISPERRLPGFEDQAYYHPLFAYEAFALLALVSVLWLLSKKGFGGIFGTGRYFLWYVCSYAVLRFLLDFLRMDVQRVWWGMGINQLFLLCCLFAIGLWRMIAMRKAASLSRHA